MEPSFFVNGITQEFFAGEGIEKLHHIALPSSIEAKNAKNAFANCKALVSLDLSNMKPLEKNESDELLNGLPENAVYMRQWGKPKSIVLIIIVLTTDNGERQASYFKLILMIISTNLH